MTKHQKHLSFFIALLALPTLAGTVEEKNNVTTRYRQGSAITFDPQVVIADEDGTWSFPANSLRHIPDLNNQLAPAIGVLLDENLTISNTLQGLSFPAANLINVSNEIILLFDGSGGSLNLYPPGWPMVSVNFPNLLSLDGSLEFQDFDALTNADFPQLSLIESNGFLVFTLTTNCVFEFPKLAAITDYGVLQFADTDNSALSKLSFPLLTNILGRGGRAEIESALPVPFSFPKLTSISGSGFVEAALDILAFPVLQSVSGGAYVDVIDPTFNVTAPSFTTVGDASYSFYCPGSSDLTNVSLPNLSSVGPSAYVAYFNSCPALSTVSIPQLATAANGFTCSFNGDALNGASVNGILHSLVQATSSTTSGTVDLSGGTSSPPTGQGITDAATLVSRGITVTTN